MAMLIIDGGIPLFGSLAVQGAKNSALPLLAAALMCNGRCVLHNCPSLSDTDASCRILEYLGCTVERAGSSIVIDPAGAGRHDIPETLMREMRSSIVFLGAICARSGAALISSPGGCELGPRPIDLHLDALRKLGLVIKDDHGWLDCKVPGRLRGAKIALSFPSVGATENILLAAATAQGETTVLNAAREPEVVDLADFLNKCGARIYGAGESVIRIEGVPKLGTCEHSVIPDRIAAVTWVAAAGITGGEVELHGVNFDHIGPCVPLFEEAGCRLHIEGDRLIVRGPARPMPVKAVRTMPYPGFPTDAQAPLMAVATLASGTSVFIENIFENRFKHAAELNRLGAQIKVEGRVAVVEGHEHLYGASVEATDLRGGAALVVAALAAEGITTVKAVRHIDRGYESIETSLSALGARIRRVENED